MLLIEALLVELKDKLMITWEDDNTDRQLTRMLNNAQRYFNETCDYTFSFEEASSARELVIERCRYDWNNALDEFEQNYASSINELILNTALKVREEGVTDGDGEDKGNVQ